MLHDKCETESRRWQGCRSVSNLARVRWSGAVEAKRVFTFHALSSFGPGHAVAVLPTISSEGSHCGFGFLSRNRRNDVFYILWRILRCCFWSRNVVNRAFLFCYRNVCRSVCLSVHHTCESRLNGSRYRNMLSTIHHSSMFLASSKQLFEMLNLVR